MMMSAPTNQVGRGSEGWCTQQKWTQEIEGGGHCIVLGHDDDGSYKTGGQGK